MKSTSLSSIIKAKYQLHRYGTEKEKIEYNYLCFWSKNLPCLKFISFSQGMARTSKQVQLKRKQKKHDRTCILFPRCSDTDFMQTREPFLFVGRK